MYSLNHISKAIGQIGIVACVYYVNANLYSGNHQLKITSDKLTIQKGFEYLTLGLCVVFRFG